VSESAARELRRIDRECDFTPSARSAFQDLLAWTGQPTVQAISLPANDEPFWFRGSHSLANYHRRATFSSLAPG
jgi:hypothetical protein